jgi:two-component system, chemotaxis family, chemotaxis protein CheY
MAAGEDVVVVVEDETESREFLIQILELEGFQCLGFGNGAEALECLKKSGPPCLIVLDIRMPVMDGTQFRSALLRDPRLAKIPVIVLTAADPSAAKALSPLRIFRKPVDVDALVEVVRQVC